MKALFDSNILIDFLQGHALARAELDRYDDVAISRISWVEVLIGAQDEDESRLRQSFLDEFNLVELDAPIARETIELRKARHLKLPDAIILASARVRGAMLVTRNHRDFPADQIDIRIPY